MAFEQKEWKDRLSEYPARRTLTPVDGSTPMEVDVTRSEGTVMQQGDPFNAENMNNLEQRIADGIGGGSDVIAPIEQEISLNAYAKSDFLIFENKLYEVTTAIAVGNTLVPGVNIHEQKVSDVANQLVANNNRIYFDYHDGKYGYNTDPSRGADTFVPFRSAPDIVTQAVSGILQDDPSDPDYAGYLDVVAAKDLSNYTVNQNLFFVTTSVANAQASVGGHITVTILNSTTLRINTDNRNAIRVVSGTIYYLDY